jgi:hypothetical protein
VLCAERSLEDQSAERTIRTHDGIPYSPAAKNGGGLLRMPSKKAAAPSSLTSPKSMPRVDKVAATQTLLSLGIKSKRAVKTSRAIGRGR